jgi:hypothetical protein
VPRRADVLLGFVILSVVFSVSARPLPRY